MTNKNALNFFLFSLNLSPIEGDLQMLSPCWHMKDSEWDVLGDRKWLMTSSSMAAPQDVDSLGITRSKPVDRHHGDEAHLILSSLQLLYSEHTCGESMAGSGEYHTPGCRLDSGRTAPNNQLLFPRLPPCLTSLFLHLEAPAPCVFSGDKKASLTLLTIKSSL